MPTLLIAGQDIQHFRIGLAEGGVLLHETAGEGEPDRLLAAIDAALKAWDVAPEDLTGIAVASGPGSFTALRASVTAANAMGYALGLPVASAPLAEDAPLLALATAATGEFAAPAYGRGPRITLPKQA